LTEAEAVTMNQLLVLVLSKQEFIRQFCWSREDPNQLCRPS